MQPAKDNVVCMSDSTGNSDDDSAYESRPLRKVGGIRLPASDENEEQQVQEEKKRILRDSILNNNLGNKEYEEGHSSEEEVGSLYML